MSIDLKQLPSLHAWSATKILILCLLLVSCINNGANGQGNLIEDGNLANDGGETEAPTDFWGWFQGTSAEKFDPMRVGGYIVGLALSVPLVFIALYRALLTGSSVWPTSLFGWCAGVWGFSAAGVFGYLFRKSILLGTETDPLWHEWRLFILCLFLGGLWWVFAVMYWRRPALAKVSPTAND